MDVAREWNTRVSNSKMDVDDEDEEPLEYKTHYDIWSQGTVRLGAGWAVCMKTQSTHDMSGFRMERKPLMKSWEHMTRTPRMTAGDSARR